MSLPNSSRAEACKRCGGENPSWSAPSPLWNAVIRGGSINGTPEWDDMVCMSCFAILAEEKGIACGFRLTAEVVNVELETVTPSGRVWDDNAQRWVEPADVAIERLAGTSPPLSARRARRPTMAELPNSRRQEMLAKLAEERAARVGPDGRPRFNLTYEDCMRSSRAAMRLAGAEVAALSASSEEAGRG